MVQRTIVVRYHVPEFPHSSATFNVIVGSHIQAFSQSSYEDQNLNLFLQNGLCKSGFSTFLKLFGEISLKVIKVYTITGTFCYSWKNFIEILIKGNNLLW